MTQLQLSIQMTTQYDQVPIVAEVLDSEFTIVWEGTISIGSPTLTDALSSGRYAVRAYLPSSRILTKQLTIGERSPDPLPVNLQPPASLVKRVYRSEGDGLESMPAHSSVSHDYTIVTKGIKQPTTNILERLDEQVWLRIWERQTSGGERQVIPWIGRRNQIHDNLIQCTFGLSYGDVNESQYYLQIGSEQYGSRLIALPPVQTSITIAGIEPNDDRDLPLKIDVTHVDQTVESLIGYMNSGAMDKADRVLRKLSDDLLRAKYQDPIGATVGAYYLLRIDELSQRAGWAENLARDMHWLPDGAVIYAWHLLQNTSPNLQEAKQWLLTAVERGIPIYTEGLRLLYDALGMLVESGSSLSDAAIDTAFGFVKPYASAAIWHQSAVTFLGTDPDTPTVFSSRTRSIYENIPTSPAHAVSLGGTYLD